MLAASSNAASDTAIFDLKRRPDLRRIRNTAAKQGHVSGLKNPNPNPEWICIKLSLMDPESALILLLIHAQILSNFRLQ